MSGGSWARMSSTIEKNDPSAPQPREFVMPQKSSDNISEIEIPTIPDIDDLPESSKDGTTVSTKTPTDQTTTYRDLDSELLKHNAFVALDGVNLSPLLKFLHPDASQKESDTVWTVESLFKDLQEYYRDESI